MHGSEGKDIVHDDEDQGVEKMRLKRALYFKFSQFFCSTLRLLRRSTIASVQKPQQMNVCEHSVHLWRGRASRERVLEHFEYQGHGKT